MRAFLNFTKKEFIHIFRDTWTMMIIIVLPVVMMLLFGYAISIEIGNTNFAVLDYSKDELSKEIINRIENNEYFTLSNYFDSYKEIEESFRKSQTSAAIVFEEGFADNLLRFQKAEIKIITDGSDPNAAKSISNYLSNIIGVALKESNKLPSEDYEITPQLELLYNPMMKSSYNFVPGVMGFIIIIVCAMMTSISIVREKERGTMELLLASPTRPITIIVSKLIPYFVISFINVITILFVSYFIMNVPINGSIITILALSILYIIVSLSLGLLISTVSPTQLVALVISAILLLAPSMILSGMMFAVESMPPLLQIIAKMLPAKWFIDAIRKLMIMGVEFRFVIKEFLIIIAMIIMILAVSLKLFKKRLE